MKKIIKKISTIFLAFIITLSNLVGVRAYEQEINIEEDDIMMPYSITSSGDNYIKVWRDFANDSVIVNSQYVALTEEQFKNIEKKVNSNKAYVEEQSEIIKQKSDALTKEEEEVEILEEIANQVGATQEQKDAYQAAVDKYNQLLNEYNTYKDNVDKQIEGNHKEYLKLIPSYDDNKWIELALTEKDNYNYKYKIEYPNNVEYLVLWAKVTVNGKDYYNYSMYCVKKNEIQYYCEIKDGKYYNSEGNEVTETEYKVDCGEETEEKYYCEIKEGKYYDNEGNEVSKVEYEKECVTPKNPKTGLNNNILYGILISLVALSSYVVVRKFRRFSK